MADDQVLTVFYDTEVAEPVCFKNDPNDRMVQGVWREKMKSKIGKAAQAFEDVWWFVDWDGVMAGWTWRGSLRHSP